MAEKKTKIANSVGTMIEVPRVVLTAAEFVSFGTNDLTQAALGMSHDDSGSFPLGYAELEMVEQNPFATIDQTAGSAFRFYRQFSCEHPILRA